MAQTDLIAGDSGAAGGLTGGDDGTMRLRVGPNGAKVTAANVAADGTMTLLKQPVLPVQSMIRLNTGNGYGSTNTVIRRFTNVVTNQGTDITYNSGTEATAGASFTINTAGVYAISYSDVFVGASYHGLSLNSAQLTTIIQAITASDRLVMATAPGANLPSNLGITLYLPAGSIIRPHTDGSGAAATPERASFTITRVA